MVTGANDGVITTFAVVAGVSGASLPPRMALILGLANLAADGVSMGASSYLALKSELEQTGASVGEERPWRHGLVTLLAFVAAGAVPLLAYLPVFRGSGSLFPAASVLAAMTLAAVGAARAPFVAKSAWICAVEMLLVGGMAGSAAFALGVLVERWTR